MPSEIFQRYGPWALVVAAVIAVFVWLIAHIAAAPGGKVSVLWGLVGYTKRAPDGPDVQASEAINDNPRARLTKVFERMTSLINTWEDGHVAGPDAHRIDVAKLYAEADDILSKHYSASEAARFRDVKAQDARDYPDSALAQDAVDEAQAREFLLDAKAKFIYELLEKQLG